MFMYKSFILNVYFSTKYHNTAEFASFVGIGTLSYNLRLFDKQTVVNSGIYKRWETVGRPVRPFSVQLKRTHSVLRSRYSYYLPYSVLSHLHVADAASLASGVFFIHRHSLSNAVCVTKALSPTTGHSYGSRSNFSLPSKKRVMLRGFFNRVTANACFCASGLHFRLIIIIFLSYYFFRLIQNHPHLSKREL